MKACASKILQLAQETENEYEKKAYITAASICLDEFCCTSTKHEACQSFGATCNVISGIQKEESDELI